MLIEFLAAWALIGLLVLVCTIAQHHGSGQNIELDLIGLAVIFTVVLGWPYCLWLAYKNLKHQ